MRKDDLRRAASAMRHIAGETCRRITPGAGDLTTLSLSFGDEVHSHWPDRGDRRTRCYRYSIRTSSAWRLETPGRVLCTFDDKKPKGGKVRRLLAELEGQRAVAAKMTAPAGDLAIEFESGQVVRAFGLIGEGDRSYTWDYYFCDRTPQREIYFSVGPRGAINFNWPDPAQP